MVNTSEKEKDDNDYCNGMDGASSLWTFLWMSLLPTDETTMNMTTRMMAREEEGKIIKKRADNEDGVWEVVFIFFLLA